MISIRGAVRPILGTLAVASILILLQRNDARAQQAPDPRQAMVKGLGASGPHPSLGDEAQVWDRFIGTWDCEYTFFLDDGSRRQSRGEIEFGWILDGRAVQDIWITYPKEAGKERGIGTTVRFFDSKSKTWRIVFVGPRYNALVALQGSAEGDRIVLRGVDDEGAMLRWSFNDLKGDSFIWRGEKSRDGGKTWKLEEEHHMKRRNSDATAKPLTGYGVKTTILQTSQTTESIRRQYE